MYVKFSSMKKILLVVSTVLLGVSAATALVTNRESVQRADFEVVANENDCCDFNSSSGLPLGFPNGYIDCPDCNARFMWQMTENQFVYRCIVCGHYLVIYN